MHHLVLGIDPVELGGAPFALATDEALTLQATEIGLKINGSARLYVLPCIAGHVGADAAGVILAERPDLSEKLTLLVDVGTNAEIVLGNRERLLACSSPTGPAFEGAQISCGQRAAPGAIERVRIDPQTLEPRFKVIGSDLWSDEPGFAEASARTGVTGICGSGIIEVIAEMYLAGIINQDGVIDGALAARSPRIVANGRTFSYTAPSGRRQRPAADHPERRARDPARQGGAVCRHPRCSWITLGAEPGRAHPPGRRLRQPHRRQVRDGARHDPGLRLKPGVAPPATPPAPARASRSWISPRARSSRIWCGGWRRSRPRSSRKFQAHFVEAMGIPHSTASSPHLAQVVQLPRAAPPAPRVSPRGRNRRPG